jgi:xanthine dehydrogenase/oxidase
MAACNLPGRKVIVENTRCGGGFGSKIIHCNLLATAVGICAHSLKRPVKVQLNRNQDMIAAGNRSPYYSKYEVGFDSTGVINALHIQFYEDTGFEQTISQSSIGGVHYFLDNAYNIANWKSQGYACKTNLPPNTWMRAPGTVNAMYMIESVIEKVASSLNVSADVVRAANYYKEGSTTPYGQVLNAFTLDKVLDDLYQRSNYQDRVAEVAAFNQNNRWRKRGIYLVPVKYGMSLANNYEAVVSVNLIADDGSVYINQSGIEVGQGLYTKVAQAVAYALGIDLETISVGSVSTEKLPNFGVTGGSGTSETCVQAALMACAELKTRLQPIKDANPSFTWVQILQAANNAAIDLSATGVYIPRRQGDGPADYYVYAAGISEVEIDVLTGEIHVLQVDITYDCGESLNPALDIGQIEGALIKGLGFCLTEERVLGSDGKNLSNGTWEYKPPMALDIPIKFNVALLNNVQNPYGILKSKASAEPPYSLCFSIFFAAKNAIYAARSELGHADRVFDLDLPATVARIQLACQVSADDLKIE